MSDKSCKSIRTKIAQVERSGSLTEVSFRQGPSQDSIKISGHSIAFEGVVFRSTRFVAGRSDPPFTVEPRTGEELEISAIDGVITVKAVAKLKSEPASDPFVGEIVNPSIVDHPTMKSSFGGMTPVTMEGNLSSLPMLSTGEWTWLPMVPCRVARLYIPLEVAACVEVERVTVGRNHVLASGHNVPGRAFARIGGAALVQSDPIVRVVVKRTTMNSMPSTSPVLFIRPRLES